MANLNEVTVLFKDSKHNYSTNVSADSTKEDIERYFRYVLFDRGIFPNEDMQECIGIEFVYKNIVSFTDLMNASLRFKTHLRDYLILVGREAGDIREALALITKFEEKSQRDEQFRCEYYNWVTNKEHYSTIVLRSLANLVCVDYWNGLDESNLIDVIDSASANFK